MLRLIGGLLAGLITAIAVVSLGEAVGHALFPPPPDVDLNDPAALRDIIGRLPTGAIVAVLLAWAAGAFAGGAVATWVTHKSWAAWLIGGLMLAAGTTSMIMIPHPVWFMLASLPATLLPAWIAARLFGPRNSARP